MRVQACVDTIIAFERAVEFGGEVWFILIVQMVACIRLRARQVKLIVMGMSVGGVFLFFKDLPMLVENQSAWQQDREVGDDGLFDLPKKDPRGVLVIFKHCEEVKQGLVGQHCKRLQRQQETHLFDRLNLGVKPVIVVFLEEI